MKANPEHGRTADIAPKTSQVGFAFFIPISMSALQGHRNCISFCIKFMNVDRSTLEQRTLNDESKKLAVVFACRAPRLVSKEIMAL